MQSNKESIIETITNIGSGMILSWIVTIYGLPLLIPIESVRPSEALKVTCFYTIISLARSYFWRRFFNKRILKAYS